MCINKDCITAQMGSICLYVDAAAKRPWHMKHSMPTGDYTAVDQFDSLHEEDPE